MLDNKKTRNSLMNAYNIDELEEWTEGTYNIKFLEASDKMRLEVAFFDSGIKSWVHCHPKADEFYYVIKGEGILTYPRYEKLKREGKGFTVSYDTDVIHFKPGTAVLFRAGELHQIETKSKVILLRIQAGENLHEIAVAGKGLIHFPDWDKAPPRD